MINQSQHNDVTTTYTAHKLWHILLKYCLQTPRVLRQINELYKKLCVQVLVLKMDMEHI